MNLDWRKTVLLIAGATLLVVLWLGRYELATPAMGGASSQIGDVYVLDRWTGGLTLVGNGNAVQVRRVDEDGDRKKQPRYP